MIHCTPTSSLYCLAEEGKGDLGVFTPTERYCKGQITFRLVGSTRLRQRIVLIMSSVFSSGFSEASSDQGQLFGGDTDDGASDDTYLGRQYDDSDDEDDEFMMHTIDEPSFDAELEIEDDAGPSVPVTSTSNAESSAHSMEDDTQVSNGLEDAQNPNVRLKLSHSSSPISLYVALHKGETDWTKLSAPSEVKEVAGPKKMRVVIRDVAYATYRAVLYYVSNMALGILLYNH
jgi:hypothetical protein